MFIVKILDCPEEVTSKLKILGIDQKPPERIEVTYEQLQSVEVLLENNGIPYELYRV